jgi:hypothetical protein
MTDSNVSFLGRISLAVGTFFSILGDGEFAARVQRLRSGAPVTAAPVATPAPVAAPAPTPAPQPAAPTLKQATPDAALQLLGLLQRDARFIDFVEEDVAGYSDADIGAAARVVHGGCRTVLREHFTIRPVREEAEGSRVTLPERHRHPPDRQRGRQGAVYRQPQPSRLARRGRASAEAGSQPRRVRHCSG